MLTFFVLLAGEEPARDLPATRAGVYEAHLKELLLTWEARRREQSGLGLSLGSLEGEAARRAALAGVYLLGWRLHWLYFGGQGEDMPTWEELEDALAWYLPWLLPEDGLRNLAADIMAFWKQAGLFVYWHLEGKDFLAFRYLTFQEYAAAVRVLADLWGQGRD